MVTVRTLPYSRPLSRLDLELMPDDGHRYELVDGAMIVTPAPSPRVLQPDLLLAPRADFTERKPSGRALARGRGAVTKHAIDRSEPQARPLSGGRMPVLLGYRDPDEPSLTAWELRGGEYVEVGHVVGDEEYAVATPYQVTIVPARLLD